MEGKQEPPAAPAPFPFLLVYSITISLSILHNRHTWDRAIRNICKAGRARPLPSYPRDLPRRYHYNHVMQNQSPKYPLVMAEPVILLCVCVCVGGYPFSTLYIISSSIEIFPNLTSHPVCQPLNAQKCLHAI